MKSKKKLTKIICDAAAYEGKNGNFYALWDSELSGFGLRVTPSGGKSFVVSYRLKGRKRMMSLGRYGVMTIDAARKVARERLVEVVKGIDPLEEKITARQSMKVKELCSVFLEKYSKIHKKTWKEDERRINSRIIPKFGNKRIEDLKRNHVIEYHQEIGRMFRYESNRIITLISTIYEKAREWGLIEENHPNPARGFPLFKEEARDRWVKPEELPALAEAIDTEKNIYIRACLWLYILTGCRKRELLRATWKDVDFNQRQLRLPDTKAGTTQYVELSQPAIQILKDIPRLQGNEHVFPGIKEGKHLHNIDKPWRRVRKLAGLTDVRLHDLRRTMGSWLAISGTSQLMIGKILRHQDKDSTEVYTHLSRDPLKEAVESYGEKIIDITSLKRKGDENEKAS